MAQGNIPEPFNYLSTQILLPKLIFGNSNETILFLRLQ
jgi:hypothetical protein